MEVSNVRERWRRHGKVERFTDATTARHGCFGGVSRGLAPRMKLCRGGTISLLEGDVRITAAIPQSSLSRLFPRARVGLGFRYSKVPGFRQCSLLHQENKRTTCRPTIRRRGLHFSLTSRGRLPERCRPFRPTKDDFYLVVPTEGSEAPAARAS